MGLWSFWYGGSAIGAIDDGYNVGTGFYYDSEKGDGLYLTAGESKKFGLSLGAEAALYSGSIEGKTTTVTAGIAFFSIGVIVGEGDNIFGLNFGIVGGLSLGAPIEFSISNNTTWATKGTKNEEDTTCP